MAKHSATEINSIDQQLAELRVSPAGHLAETMAAASVAAVSLREIPFPVQLGLRAIQGSESAAALEGALGVALPSHVGEVTGDAEGLHIIWLSPDEFHVVDVSRTQRPGDSAECEAALEGLPGQAVDLSANRTLLELAGAGARDVLEKGCRADLHTRAFPVGSAIATQLGVVPVILHRAGDEQFRIYPRSSFADYVVHWLIDGMHEFSDGDGAV
ncbi:sarcosine oxidase subunit gamma [Leucobacter sp. GX24907]